MRAMKFFHAKIGIPLFSLSREKGPDFAHNARPDFRRRQTRGLLKMWTVFIQ